MSTSKAVLGSFPKLIPGEKPRPMTEEEKRKERKRRTPRHAAPRG